jgi:hypothetical protein
MSENSVKPLSAVTMAILRLRLQKTSVDARSDITKSGMEAQVIRFVFHMGV